ncbi:putative guanylyl cyclase, partial [Toxoplasma gondii FOU]
VLEEFQQDKLKLAYLHENVTFLFADICGFTSWAKGVDACEVRTRFGEKRNFASEMCFSPFCPRRPEPICRVF